MAVGSILTKASELLVPLNCGPIVYVNFKSNFKLGEDDLDGEDRSQIADLKNAPMYTSIVKCPVTGETFPSGMLLSGFDKKYPVKRGGDDDPEYWYFNLKIARTAAVGAYLDYLGYLIGVRPEYCKRGNRPTRFASLRQTFDFLSNHNNLENLHRATARETNEFVLSQLKYHFFTRKSLNGQQGHQVWTVMFNPLDEREDTEIIIRPNHNSHNGVYQIHNVTSEKEAIQNAMIGNVPCPIRSIVVNLSDYSRYTVDDLKGKITEFTKGGISLDPWAAIHWDQWESTFKDWKQQMNTNRITVQRLRQEIQVIRSLQKRYQNSHYSGECNIINSRDKLVEMINRYEGSTHILFDFEMSRRESTSRQRLCVMSFVCNNDPDPNLILLNTTEMWRAFSNEMPRVFADTNSIKIGFSVQLDCITLFQDFGILVVNGIDLQLFRGGMDKSGKAVGLLDHCHSAKAISDDDVKQQKRIKVHHQRDFRFEELTADDNDSMKRARSYAMWDATILPKLLSCLIDNVYEGKITDEDLNNVINTSLTRFQAITISFPPKPSSNKKKTLYSNEYFNGLLLNRSARSGIGSDIHDVVLSCSVMLKLHDLRWRLALKYDRPEHTVFCDRLIAMLAYKSGRLNAEEVTEGLNEIFDQPLLE